MVGREDDLVIAPEGLAADAGQLKERFGLHGNIFTGQPVKATPAPWGWSADAKRQFTLAGVRPETLPSDEMIGRLRLLSHRRMTIEIIKGLEGGLSDSDRGNRSGVSGRGREAFARMFHQVSVVRERARCVLRAFA